MLLSSFSFEKKRESADSQQSEETIMEEYEQVVQEKDPQLSRNVAHGHTAKASTLFSETEPVNPTKLHRITALEPGQTDLLAIRKEF